MTKKVNVQSITETKTTVTTVTTTTELPPVTYMPITPSQEPGSEQFYKDNGGKVRKMNKFGKYRTYAIVPVEGYEDASDEEKKLSKLRQNPSIVPLITTEEIWLVLLKIILTMKLPFFLL